jgi:hypothetical protein
LVWNKIKQSIGKGFIDYDTIETAEQVIEVLGNDITIGEAKIAIEIKVEYPTDKKDWDCPSVIF